MLACRPADPSTSPRSAAREPGWPPATPPTTRPALSPHPNNTSCQPHAGRTRSLRRVTFPTHTAHTAPACRHELLSRAFVGCSRPAPELALVQSSAPVACPALPCRCHSWCCRQRLPGVGGSRKGVVYHASMHCMQAIFRALGVVREQDWYHECGTEVLLYRGAWQEWEPWEVDLAVPLSPAELQQKVDAIFKHQSQVSPAATTGAAWRWAQAASRRQHPASCSPRPSPLAGKRRRLCLPPFLELNRFFFHVASLKSGTSYSAPPAFCRRTAPCSLEQTLESSGSAPRSATAPRRRCTTGGPAAPAWQLSDRAWTRFWETLPACPSLQAGPGRVRSHGGICAVRPLRRRPLPPLLPAAARGVGGAGGAQGRRACGAVASATSEISGIAAS